MTFTIRFECANSSLTIAVGLARYPIKWAFQPILRLAPHKRTPNLHIAKKLLQMREKVLLVPKMDNVFLQEPLKSADDVIKEIDDILDEDAEDESGSPSATQSGQNPSQTASTFSSMQRSSRIVAQVRKKGKFTESFVNFDYF